MAFDAGNVPIARDPQIQEIYRQFDRVLTGGHGMSVIVGSAGVGKTYLVESCIDFFANNNAALIRTKCRQHSKGSLSPLVNILDRIIDHILTLPNASYQKIKDKVNESMGDRFAILGSLCPRILEAIGSPRETAETQHSPAEVAEAVVHFIRILSVPLFPMVIFIDDIQWCDEISLGILQRLTADHGVNIHFILAYRDDEAPRFLRRFIQEHGARVVSLPCFTGDEARQYIRASLDGEIEHGEALDEILYSLTGGNAFYLSALLRDFLDQGIIHGSGPGRYGFDVEKIRRLHLPGGVKQAILEKTRGLGEDEIHLLRVLACCGGAAGYEMMALLGDEDVRALLDRLCEKAVLVRYGEDTYMFIHDIVYNAVYTEIPKNAAARLRLGVINGLIKDNAKKYALVIVSLLIQIDREQLLNEYVHTYIDILHRAAVEAKKTASFAHALELFSLCEYLMEKSQTGASLDLQLDFMECEYVSEHENRARERYGRLIEQYTGDDALAVKLRYIDFYAFSADWERVLSFGKEILASLGLRLRSRFLYGDLVRIRALYTRRSIEGIRNAPVITDKRILTILRVLTIMFPGANRIDEKLFTMITVKLALLTGQYGNSRYSGIGYACACYLLFFVFNGYYSGNRLQKLTLELLEEEGRGYDKAIPYALIGTFTYHLCNPFSDTLKVLGRSIQYAPAENEYLYSNYAIVFSIITKYVMGEKLPQIGAYIRQSMSKKKRLENYLTRHMYDIYISQIAYLEEGYEDYRDRADREKQSFHETISLNYEMIRVHRLLIEGRIRDAFNLADRIEDRVWRHKGFVLNGHFAFYSALSRMMVYHSLPTLEKRKNKRIIKRHIRWIKKCARFDNSSCKAMALLLETEYNFYIRKKQGTDKDHYRAMVFARQDQNIQLEALANLLISRHYTYNLKLSVFYAGEAARLFRQWGARYIADVIGKAAGADVPVEAQSKDEKPVSTGDIRDALTYINRINTMSHEEICREFIDLILQEHTVKRCALLFEQNDDMYVWYDRSARRQWDIDNTATSIKYMDNIPQTLIRYVSRTGEGAAVDGRGRESLFMTDPYLADQDMSIACFPMKQDDILAGIVYMECDGQITDTTLAVIRDFTPTVIGKMKGAPGPQASGAALTNRESEIMNLLSKGLSNEEVSRKLYVTVGTVRNHLSNIYRKLGVASRVQAVLKAGELNLLS